jgi:aspartate kinase
MGIIVAKFGGTSLADAEQFRKVKAIVEADSRRRYIVPSAPGKRYSTDHKITDLLYSYHSKVTNNLPSDEVFNQILNRFSNIIDELGVSLDIKPYLERIRLDIEGGASCDYAASRGEYLSGIILASFLGFNFVDPAEMIFFNECGRFDDEATQQAVSSKLTDYERAVIPGFYGSMPNGHIKTFPRGGSDITGSVIARGVSAEVYENWTDVSGFLVADPKIVDKPRLINKVTYRELRELSYMGASVLHEDSIYPVQRAGIPINIKNTNSPHEAGTLIVQDAEPVTHTGGITGIAGRKDFTVIALEKTYMNMELGFGRRLLSIIEDKGISFEHMPSGIDTISLVIADSQLNGKLDEVMFDIKNQLNPDKIEVFTDMALIATVGQGMAYTPGMASRIFSALSEQGINVRMIDQGPSEINIIIGIEGKNFENAVKAIYCAFESKDTNRQEKDGCDELFAGDIRGHRRSG